MPSKTSSPYLVSRYLTAIPAKELLNSRQLRPGLELAAPTPREPEAEDRPVVDGRKGLRVGELYRLSANPRVFCYLPKYALATDTDGSPGVELRFQPPGDNDDGMRRLTVNASWTKPATRRRRERVEVMDHRADLVLQYQVPIAGPDGSATTQPGATQTVTLQPLQMTSDLSAKSVTEFADRESFEIVYAAMRTASSKARLEIRVSAAVWLQTFRQVMLGKASASSVAELYLSREAAMTRFVKREDVLAATATSSTAHASVTVSRPTASVAMSGALLGDTRLRETAVVHPAARSRTLEAATHRATLSPAVMMAASRPATRQPVRRMTMARPVATATVRRPAGTARPAAGVAADSAVRPVARSSAHARSAVTFARAAHASVAKAKLSKLALRSDQVVKGRRVVPTEIALDNKQQPALLAATLTTTHGVAFHFDPSDARNARVFVAPEMTGIHLLMPLELVSPTGTRHTVYQDNLMPDVVHVEPTLFRLVRESLPPYRPSLSFVGSEFSTSDDDSDAEIFFQMMMVYRLEPWIDPKIMQLARDALSAQGLAARFVASVSTDAALELDLDFLGEEQARGEADVDSDEGVTDSLMLDEDAFIQLWRDRLGGGGEGITGAVRHRLFDGTQVRTRARLTFWESSDEVFETSFLGPVEGRPGIYKVLLRNRIESPAVIEELPGETIDGGGAAHAQQAGSLIGRTLRPQESLEVEYSVTPADAPVVMLDPSVVGRVEPDLQALLRMIMVNTAAGSLGFALTVRAVQGTFTPPGGDDGDDVLTALRIEFDDGSEVELDADQTEAEVTVTSRLINALIGGQQDQQRYFYRVTNVHPTGEGARTAWIVGHGDQPLEVGHAVVDLGLD